MARRVLTLIDEANISASAREAGVKDVDWRTLAAFLVAREPDRQPLDTYMYVGLPPEMEEFAEQRREKEEFVHDLRMQGFMVVTYEGGPTQPGHYSANIDVLMALDAMDLAYTVHPDVVVLVTGDADFTYLVQKLRRRGVRVEVAAPADSTGRHLKESANVVVDLAPLFRAVVEGRKPRERPKAGFAMGNGRGAEPPREE